MNYNMDLFWRRAANLWKAHQAAQDPDFKRIWMDKLQSLMQGIKGVDKKEKTARIFCAKSFFRFF